MESQYLTVQKVILYLENEVQGHLSADTKQALHLMLRKKIENQTCGNLGAVFDLWLGKILWRREGNPLQYSCLGNPMDGGAWWATVHGVAESDTTECLTLSLFNTE